MPIDKEELKEAIREVMEDVSAAHALTKDDVAAIKTVSGFLTRMRNVVGNFVMVIIVALLIIALGAIVFVASAGHINLFKLFGIGG